MHSPNVLALLTLDACRVTRTFTADQRATLVRLLPSLTGMVWCLASLALAYYSVEV
jgi:hypothetical protein